MTVDDPSTDAATAASRPGPPSTPGLPPTPGRPPTPAAHATSLRFRASRAALATAVFTLLAAVFLAPVFTGHRFTAVGERRADIYPWAAFDHGDPQPAQADEADLSEPWNHQVAGALDNGSLALWNPRTFAGGSPLFSNGSSAQLWPPRIAVAAIVPAGWIHDVYSLVHLVLWGLAMYALVREFGGSVGAAIIGGALWELAAFNTGWLHLEVVVGIPLAIPLGALVVHRVARRRTWAAALGGGLVLGTVMLSGHLLWHLITLMGAAVYAGCVGLRGLVDERERPWRPRLLDAVKPGLAIATAPLAAGALLVPTLVTLGNTPRAPFGPEFVPQLVGSWSQLADLVRAPSTTPMTTEVMNAHLAFIGTVGVLLAAIGLWSRRPGSGWGRGMLVGHLALALLGPVAAIAYRVLPGFDVFYPYTRLLGWAAAGVVVLAALGVDAVADAVRRRLVLAPTRARLVGAVATGLVVAATAAQMIPLARRINPAFPERNTAASSFDATPLVRAAAEATGPGDREALIAPITQDYLATGPAGPPMLWANTATAVDLFTTSGYDSTLPVGAASVLRVADGSTPIEATKGAVGAFVPVLQIGRANPSMLHRLGVTHLAVVPEIRPDDPRLDRFGVDRSVVYDGPDGSLIALRDAAPGPWFASRVVTTSGDVASLERLAAPDSDPSEALWSRDDDTGPPQLDAGSAARDTAEADRVLAAERGRQSYRTTVRASAPRVVILPINWDPGWTVEVDGRAVDAARVNVSRVGVVVPTGDSTIVARYRPPGWMPGVAISLATLLAWAVVAWWSRRLNRLGGAR